MNFVKYISRIQFIIPILFIFFSACENDIATVNSITSGNGNKLPIESTKNVAFLYSDSAQVKSKLVAALMDRYAGKKPYYEMTKGMLIIFYGAHRKEQTKLTANYGIGYDTGNGMESVEAKGNVIVINEKGEKLNTEHLIWNALTHKIHTDAFVKITTKDQVIFGDGLVADEDFSVYEIKNVKGTIAVKDEEKK
jgi:LPS export ABC transporter protein LptC